MQRLEPSELLLSISSLYETHLLISIFNTGHEAALVAGIRLDHLIILQELVVRQHVVPHLSR